ncbi:MAG: hypothetical protein KDD73_06855 [Anaerolineales bacterium]|nr:hypothetical protein [Anaerolineales bacterium]MCB9126502.1 hypothetical protein [Ardenticatenales bacterium]
MNIEEIGKRLHDKATRGESLSSEDHALLKRWYDRQDEEEMRLLDLNPDIEAEMALQDGIDSVLSRIKAVNDEINKLSDDNKIIKSGISKIQQQLTETVPDLYAV